jgi:hypothetical protein
MHTTLWWYRLHFWQWIQAGRANPMRWAVALLAWWLPCVIAPLILLLAGPAISLAALNFLLSLDVPLTLMLAGATTLDALGVESRAASEDWIWPRAFRQVHLRWMSRQRWLYVVRWPAGLVIAASLLASGAASSPESLSELRMMALLGLVCGSAFAWAMQRPATPKQRPAKIHRLHGVAALSWIALRDARERFDLRRAALLAVPALLAAPLGAPAGEVVKMLALWLPFLFVLIVMREATHVHGALRRWLSGTLKSGMWLTWWVWRYIVLAVAVLVSVGILWWKFGMAAAASLR